MTSSFGPYWRCRCLWHGQRVCCGGGVPNCSGQLGDGHQKAARDMFPVSNYKGYMSTPWALGGQACKAAPQASRKDGNPTLLSLWPCTASLTYFHQGIVARYRHDPHRWSLPPDGNCTCSLCVLGCGCTVGLCLFDGLSSLGLILMQGGFSIRYQPSLVGVHGSPSYEQLPHGCIHFPLQSKYLLWQGAWASPRVSPRLWSGWNAGCSQSFQCRRQGWWVTDCNSGRDVIRPGHALQCLWGSGQWLRHRWVCSLWAEWVLYSYGGRAPKAADGSSLPGCCAGR